MSWASLCSQGTGHRPRAPPSGHQRVSGPPLGSHSRPEMRRRVPKCLPVRRHRPGRAGLGDGGEERGGDVTQARTARPEGPVPATRPGSRGEGHAGVPGGRGGRPVTSQQGPGDASGVFPEPGIAVGVFFPEKPRHDPIYIVKKQTKTSSCCFESFLEGPWEGRRR